jgi:hypothetical protein
VVVPIDRGGIVVSTVCEQITGTRLHVVWSVWGRTP